MPTPAASKPTALPANLSLYITSSMACLPKCQPAPMQSILHQSLPLDLLLFLPVCLFACLHLCMPASIPVSMPTTMSSSLSSCPCASLLFLCLPVTIPPCNYACPSRSHAVSSLLIVFACLLIELSNVRLSVCLYMYLYLPACLYVRYLRTYLRFCFYR